MPRSAQQLLSEALQLSDEERLELAIELLGSVVPEVPGSTRTDEEWIAEGCSHGWVLLTKDKRIRYRADELEALQEGHLFCLVSGNLDIEGMTQAFLDALSAAGRDSLTQAVLPLRGKILNTESLGLSKILQNNEIKDLVQALGTGIGPHFDAHLIRYSRIILLMDADSDGHHIATLLLTFFYRQLPGLVRGGHVYLAMPPLFRVDAGKDTHWALDERDRDRILASLPKNTKPEVTRFKGLGEISPAEFKQFIGKDMRLSQVEYAPKVDSQQILSFYMGKNTPERKDYIMENLVVTVEK